MKHPKQRIANLFFANLHFKYCAFLTIVCIVISLVAFITRPHPDISDCYKPDFWHGNCDLAKWVVLSENPVSGLKDSILANRPMFAWIAFLAAQPFKLLGMDRIIFQSSGYTASLSTLVGIMLVNLLFFWATVMLLYYLSFEVSGSFPVATVASFLWATSFYAYHWAYHPVNMMPGLFIVFAFPLFAWRIPKLSFILVVIIALGFGIMLLMKAYLTLPIALLIWSFVDKEMNGRRWYGIVGSVLMLLPSWIWQVAYQQITNTPLVDFHFGSGGAVSYLVTKVSSMNALVITIQQIIVDLVRMPTVISSSAGVIITIAALGYFLDPEAWAKYSRFISFAWVFCLCAFVGLSATGWLINRHGGDFFSILYPAAAIYLVFLAERFRDRRVWTIAILFWIVFTIFSYSPFWLRLSGII